MLIKNVNDITEVARLVKGKRAVVSFHHNEIFIRITVDKISQETVKNFLMK
jgi:hypothetical protein